MKMLLAAASGGAIGAAGRYLVGFGAVRLFGLGFPWGTLIVNIAGCLLLGVIIEAVALKYSVSNVVRTFLTTGILGGFTTFSAFALDFSVLLQRKDVVQAWAYLGGSVFLSILALLVGLNLVRAVIQ